MESPILFKADIINSDTNDDKVRDKTKEKGNKTIQKETTVTKELNRHKTQKPKKWEIKGRKYYYHTAEMKNRLQDKN